MATPHNPDILLPVSRTIAGLSRAVAAASRRRPSPCLISAGFTSPVLEESQNRRLSQAAAPGSGAPRRRRRRRHRAATASRLRPREARTGRTLREAGVALSISLAARGRPRCRDH